MTVGGLPPFASSQRDKHTLTATAKTVAENLASERTSAASRRSATSLSLRPGVARTLYRTDAPARPDSMYRRCQAFGPFAAAGVPPSAATHLSPSPPRVSSPTL